MKKVTCVLIGWILCTILCGSGWGADKDVERVRFKDNTDIAKDPMVMSEYKRTGYEEQNVRYTYNQRGQMVRAVGNTWGNTWI